MFVGAYERQLDERGRVALPATFRATLGTDPFLALGPDGCVQVLSAEQFHADAGEMIAGVKDGSISRQRARAFSASAVQAKVDKQGRVTLEPRLRDHARLAPQSAVVVLGNLDRIELWEPVRYADQTAAGSDEFGGDVLSPSDPTTSQDHA